MPTSRLRLTCLAMCTLAVAAACSSGGTSGPNVTIGQIAQHYDQIATNYSHGGATPVDSDPLGPECPSQLECRIGGGGVRSALRARFAKRNGPFPGMKGPPPLC